MDYSTTFARHFARLVWLIAEEPENVEEQKGALRALVTIGKQGATRLALRAGRVEANDNTIPDVLTGVPELRARLEAHGAVAVAIAEAAPPGDLLALARQLVAVEGVDEGAGFRDLIAALPGGAVRIELRAGTGAVPDSGGVTVLEGFDLLDAAPPTPVSERRGPELQVPKISAPAESNGLFHQFAAVNASKQPADVLLAKLDGVQGANAIGNLLEELTLAAEQAVSDMRPVEAAELFHGIVLREELAKDDATRRAYAQAIRRMCTTLLLRAVAMLLPRRRERALEYVKVLVRAGEHGADAVIEQLTQAQTADDRRAYFDVLLTLRAGVPALIHMLGDPRWYVVRNAAELLGEMQAAEAEDALTGLLRHSDDRIRRAASNALMRMETPRALQAIAAALRDTTAEVRIHAAAALGARRDATLAPMLGEALEQEDDEEVQIALLSALGRVGGSDAVQRLTRAAEPDGRLFRRKSTELRVAAVQALGEARTPAAMAALNSLREDREKEVRDVAIRMLTTRK